MTLATTADLLVRARAGRSYLRPARDRVADVVAGLTTVIGGPS
ncbi:MAG: hypothetical protein ABIQ53_09885 [Terracoccus sp.]